MTNSEIFISYAWGGESEKIVNELDAAFQQKNITIVRDKRDLGFKGMITDFMQQIGTGKAVILVISDKYLKSPYCMYELLEIYRNLKFQERIFPIVMEDAQIFEPLKRLQYLKHWKDKKQELDDAIRDFGTDAITVIGDDYKTYSKIFNNFGEVSNILKDINALTPQMHREDNFKTLVEAVEKMFTSTNQVSTKTTDEVIPNKPVANELDLKKEAIRNLIGKNKLDKVFEELEKILNSQDDKDTLMSYANRFRNNETKKRKNIISEDAYNMETARIVDGLLELLKSME